MDYLKAPSTPQNGATNSVINSITNQFSVSNIDPNDPSLQTSTLSQSSKYFAEYSIDFWGTNLM